MQSPDNEDFALLLLLWSILEKQCIEKLKAMFQGNNSL